MVGDTTGHDTTGHDTPRNGCGGAGANAANHVIEGSPQPPLLSEQLGEELVIPEGSPLMPPLATKLDPTFQSNSGAAAGGADDPVVEALARRLEERLLPLLVPDLVSRFEALLAEQSAKILKQNAEQLEAHSARVLEESRKTLEGKLDEVTEAVTDAANTVRRSSQAVGAAVAVVGQGGGGGGGGGDFNPRRSEELYPPGFAGRCV